MKATGLTRRVDSLGRVVIPKELRKVLRIQEGSPLEIYTDGDEGINFKKIFSYRRASQHIAVVCGKSGAGIWTSCMYR